MNKIYILFIAGLFVIPGVITVHAQQNTVQDNIHASNNTSSHNILDEVIYDYQHGIRFKDVLPVAIGILAFSYFIWKSGKVLSKREVFLIKTKYTAEGSKVSPAKRKIFYVVKYLLIFPIILYGWVVVCFFFMYALNTSLSFGTLTLIMVGIILASRIAAHWNESLAEDILKFLPFNLLFTLLINPVLDTSKILSSLEHFPVILLELTIFIAFTSILEGVLKLTYFLVSKSRHPSTDHTSPIKKT
ncbi:MAG: hypothetical protein D4R90_05405 [Nitrosopumilales archaeon]|nr:MAG: hypothetical protein D4R90_05405 [Nitrosopumilales archaeon]